jgi:hypothetical protein
MRAESERERVREKKKTTTKRKNKEKRASRLLFCSNVVGDERHLISFIELLAAERFVYKEKERADCVEDAVYLKRWAIAFEEYGVLLFEAPRIMLL